MFTWEHMLGDLAGVYVHASATVVMHAYNIGGTYLGIMAVKSQCVHTYS